MLHVKSCELTDRKALFRGLKSVGDDQRPGTSKSWHEAAANR